MKIHTGNSSRFYGSQIQSIEAGFVELGHEITPHISEADLVYQNNAPYDGLIADKLRGVIKGKLIFTVLDLPFHIPSFDYAALNVQLGHADAICTISHFVRWQVHTQLSRDTHVIYNPIKPVSRIGALDRLTPNLFAHVGRRSDANKRFSLAVQALQSLGIAEQDVALVGSEPGWGTHLAVLADQNLNGVYNQVDFVMCTSFLEGMCLPVLEAMAVGAIPVVCNDMTTSEELLPYELFPEYDDIQADPKSIAEFIAPLMADEAKKRDLKQRLYTHFQTTWAGRVSGCVVAQRILDVYATIL